MIDILRTWGDLILTDSIGKGGDIQTYCFSKAVMKFLFTDAKRDFLAMLYFHQ